MPWYIDHFEAEGDVRHVTRLRWDKPDGTVARYQLQTAIAIPQPGPGYGPAIAALKHIRNDLRDAAAPPDVTDIDDQLNTGGG